VCCTLLVLLVWWPLLMSMTAWSQLQSKQGGLQMHASGLFSFSLNNCLTCAALITAGQLSCS
jgi:hypothetical protein